MKDTYLVWRDEKGYAEDDAERIESYDFDMAAEAWADHDDSYSAEYSIVSGREEPIVHVKRIRDGTVKRYKVTGETVPEYTARECQGETE